MVRKKDRKEKTMNEYGGEDVLVCVKCCHIICFVPPVERVWF